MILSITADRSRWGEPPHTPRPRRLRTTVTPAGRAAALLLFWLFPRVAMAAGPSGDQAAADALYDEGRALIKAGNRAGGCAKFEASQAIAPAASTMINIARCHEQDGKLATAAEDYRRALRLNADTPSADRRKELEGLAQQGIAALDPRLPRLRVVIKGAPPGLEVRRDDKALPAADLGKAVPLDPGSHEVRASAPGHLEQVRPVTLEEGKIADVEITLPPLIPPTAPPSWSRPTGIALTAVGALGVGVGVATGIVSLNKVSAIRSICGGDHCAVGDTADQDNLSSAKTLGNVSTATLVLGGALAVTGVVLLVVHPDHKRDAAARDLRFSAGAGRLDLTGSF